MYACLRVHVTTEKGCQGRESKKWRRLNCPQRRPYVSARYGWKRSGREGSATDGGMNFNVNKKKKTAACDLSRHREGGKGEGGAAARVAPRCNLFQPLSRGNLKVGFKRGNADVAGKSGHVRAPARPPIAPTHQRSLTVGRFRNADYCAIARPRFGTWISFLSSSVFHHPGFFRSVFFFIHAKRNNPSWQTHQRGRAKRPLFGAGLFIYKFAAEPLPRIGGGDE